MIYLACPYSHPDPAVRDQRFLAACRATAELIREGHTVFSPVLIGHSLAHEGLPGDWDFWEPHDREQLTQARALVVLMLPGWEESIGVQGEIAIARAIGLPIAYLPAGRLKTPMLVLACEEASR
jgi:hypothetical protein